MTSSSFAASIAAWHDFYMLTAGAAATLLGLLFVAVSLNLRLFTNPAEPRLRAEATDTFSSFLYLVLMPLIVVAPDPDPMWLATPLLIFSAAELIATQRETGRVRRLLGTGLRGYLLDLAPSICYLGVIVLAAATLLGHSRMLTDPWMIPLVATLLGTATGNAWDLLLQTGAVKHGWDDAEASEAFDASESMRAEPSP